MFGKEIEAATGVLGRIAGAMERKNEIMERRNEIQADRAAFHKEKETRLMDMLEPAKAYMEDALKDLQENRKRQKKFDAEMAASGTPYARSPLVVQPAYQTESGDCPNPMCPHRPKESDTNA